MDASTANRQTCKRKEMGRPPSPPVCHPHRGSGWAVCGLLVLFGGLMVVAMSAANIMTGERPDKNETAPGPAHQSPQQAAMAGSPIDHLFKEMYASYVALSAESREAKGRQPMPAHAQEMLRAYVAAPGMPISDRSTFKYIIDYMETGADHPRLAIACADHGYTRAELDDLCAQGVRAPQVAAEILGRG